jgi:hypothetical protein
VNNYLHKTYIEEVIKAISKLHNGTVYKLRVNRYSYFYGYGTCLDSEVTTKTTLLGVYIVVKVEI